MRIRLAKRIMLFAMSVAAVLQAGAAHAAELPTFEMASYPVTRHQAAVLGAPGIEEQSATPLLTRDGMPASPHQLAVLAPRDREVTETASTVGVARR